MYYRKLYRSDTLFVLRSNTVDMNETDKKVYLILMIETRGIYSIRLGNSKFCFTQKLVLLHFCAFRVILAY